MSSWPEPVINQLKDEDSRSTSNEAYLTEGLSDETLLVIFNHLVNPETGNHEDLLNLSETCTKFLTIVQDKELCERIRFEWHMRASRNSFTKFLKERNRAIWITSLNVSDLYWVPSGVLKDVIIRMANLKELLAAGTQLSWNHLSEIFRASRGINKLSFSWDNTLEDDAREFSHQSPFQSGYHQLTILSKDLLYLKFLLIHIPMPNLTHCNRPQLDPYFSSPVLFYSYGTLAYLISMCKNLEQLELISWPKTSHERKSSTSTSAGTGWDEIPDGSIELPKLNQLVISVKEWPRMTTPALVQTLIKNLHMNYENNRNSQKPKVIWIDHPIIDTGIGRYIPNDRHWARFGRRSFSTLVPANLVTETKRLSYSLTFSSRDEHPKVPICPNLTHLLLINGSPSLTSLDVFYEGPSNLQSFCTSAFNLKLDWKLFVRAHNKLKEISILDSTEITQDYCVSLSKLHQLRKISIPVDCLLEIKDANEILEYKRALEEKKKVDSSGMNPSSKRKRIPKVDYLFKRQRVGFDTLTSSSGIDLSSSTNPSGLELMTVGCPKVEELEIGFDKSERTSRAGRILVDSLTSIAQWKNLTKLSLKGLPIINGTFLIEIFSQCELLESIRLSHLGSQAKCCYMIPLIQALPSCSNLRDFRLEQNYIGSPHPLLRTFEKCPKLRRLLIWSCPNEKPLEAEYVIELFEACSDLMMFYATIDKTAKTDCKKIRKRLDALFSLERPALSVIVRNTLQEDELIRYPSIHYRQMVVNNPQICQFNDFSEFSASLPLDN